jgi:hypothetical protein
MGDIVNLNRARKAKAREQATAVADANRIKFGTSKAEKKLSESQRKLDARNHSAHKRDEP